MHDSPTTTRSPFSRALLTLVAAATIAISPVAADMLGLAGSGYSAHSIPVYLISRYAHDVGHNDWAFQGQPAGRIDWVVSYVALALFWLAVSIWIAVSIGLGRHSRGERLWLRVLIAAWTAELVTGLLTLGSGAVAEWTSTPLGPTVLHAADVCSPWWSCVAAVLVVARAERSVIAIRAITAYAAVLTVLLLVPLPGPDVVKALLLALPVAIPALSRRGQASSAVTSPAPSPAPSAG